MSEHKKRKDGRKMLTKAGYKVGGHLASKADEMEADTHIKHGISEHESHLHPGKPKTRLHLKSGGNCEGLAAGGRSDRKPRGGKGKKGGTTVNVVVAHPHPKPVPVPVPVGGPGGPPPMSPGAM